MLDSIMLIGMDRFDKEMMIKVYSAKYDLIFHEKIDGPLWLGTGPFFKLVIYNMGIPDEENLLALQRMIKQDPIERPVVVITSQNTIEVHRFLATTGVFYHLIRPFEMKDLDDLIAGALRFWQKKRIDVAAPCVSQKRL